MKGFIEVYDQRTQFLKDIFLSHGYQINDKQAQNLDFYVVKNQKIDVILPVPLYVSPSLAENYCDRHIAKDWDMLMEYVYRNNNSEYEKMNLFFKGNLYSPCNMIIAKREIICEFCEWLFPILDTVVKSVGEHKDLYQNRYPGFMAERLMTYYFETKSEKYHIVYADKSFLC